MSYTALKRVGRAGLWPIVAAMFLLGACSPPGVVRATPPVLTEAPRSDPFPRQGGLTVLVTDDGCELGSGDRLPATSVRTSLELVGDPGFSPNGLSGEVRCWYEEMWSTLLDEERSAYYTSRADRDDLYTYAREMNTHIGALLTALRVTGDLAILDEVDRLAQHMRAKLADTWVGAAAFDSGSVDGYLNWVWDRPTSDVHRGRDIHEVDEMRTHALIAQIAWAFTVNSGNSSPSAVDYSERAAFWKSYLIDHFEAKWRERHDAPWPEFPFIGAPHVHETVDFIRYHHYMYLLTGEEAYREEGHRLTDMILANFVAVDTERGTALVTPRSILAEGGSQNYLLPATYVRYVFSSAVDLRLEHVGAWADDELIEGLARSLSEFMMDNGSEDFARDIGGGVSRGGVPASNPDDWARFQAGRYNISPYALLSSWDPSGTVAAVSRQVYAPISRSQRDVFIPVALMLDAVLR